MKECSTPKFWCSSRTARRKAPNYLTISSGRIPEEIVDSIAEVLKGELDSLRSLKAFQAFSFSAFEDVPRNMMEKALNTPYGVSKTSASEHFCIILGVKTKRRQKLGV